MTRRAAHIVMHHGDFLRIEMSYAGDAELEWVGRNDVRGDASLIVRYARLLYKNVSGPDGI